MSKEKIVLIGGGGHCHSVIDVIEQENKYDIMGIVNKEEFYGNIVMGYKVIGCDNDLKGIVEECSNAVITVGHIENNVLRKKLFNLAKSFGFKLPTIVSPLAYISKHTVISEGVVVMHHAVINANVRIGENSIINTKALLEHDVIVGVNCHISTGAILNGNVVVEDDSFVGSGVITKQGSRIKGFIKAGSIVK